jgi:hypothetical protein
LRKRLGTIQSEESLDPYRQVGMDPTVVAKAVFRYIVRSTTLPVYRYVPITSELVLMIDRLSLAISDFKRVQARKHDFADWQRLDWDHFRQYYSSERADDIDVQDAIEDLQKRYGQRPVSFDESFVRDILETFYDFENRCNRLRALRSRS